MAQHERAAEEKRAKAAAARGKAKQGASTPPWGAAQRADDSRDYWGHNDGVECGLELAVAACLAADCLVSMALTRSKTALRLTVINGAEKGVEYLQAGEPDRNQVRLEAVIRWAMESDKYDEGLALMLLPPQRP